jgi:diacylglycerol kinase
MKKVFRSFGYAFKGFSYALKTELNFRIHLAAAVLAFLLAGYLRIAVNEWLWIALCVAMVLTAELLNTAIEILTDLISPGYHQKAAYIKDVSAAAVTVTAIFAVVVGCIIFLPKIIVLF